MRNIFCLLFSILFCLQSCGNREVSYSDVRYDAKTQTILYEDKPFTGKVIGDPSHPNDCVIIRDGKVTDVITTIVKSNGYKVITHKDGSSEYYDYKGKRITKSEYNSNN